MSMIVRPAEAGWTAIVEMQKEKAEKKKSRRNKVIAVGLTLATVIGLATIGNKSSNKMAELGQKVDDLVVNKEWYKKACNGWNTLKTKVKDWFLKNDNDFIRNTATDFAEVNKLVLKFMYKFEECRIVKTVLGKKRTNLSDLH